MYHFPQFRSYALLGMLDLVLILGISKDEVDGWNSSILVRRMT